MDDLLKSLLDKFGPQSVWTGPALAGRGSSYLEDSPLTAKALLRPASTAEVAAMLSLCNAASQAVVPQGGLTNLVYSTYTTGEEIALSLERMNMVEEIDPRGKGTGDVAVVAESVRLTGRLKLLQAVPALVGVAGAHAERAIRLAAVQALAEIGSPGAMQGLERTLDDDDREVRLAAVRVLGQRRHRASIGRIETLVQGKDVRSADLTEKMAFFEAYGAMVGEEGVAILDAMLNSGGFLRKREDPEVRACAAMALGRIGSPAAQAALKRAADTKEALVRNAVARALRGGAGTGA